MRTIEDLKVEKTFYKREKDIYGGVERIPYTKMVKREVQTVSQGIRFGYYIIDFILFVGFCYAFGMLLGIIGAATGSLDQILAVLNGTNWRIGPLSFSLFDYLMLLIFYVLLEGIFGATIGKLIFGYTVINEQAQKPDFGTLVLRNIIRFVPFERFSCIGDRGWHDTWSKTYVVKKGEKGELQKLLGQPKGEDILD